MSHAQTRALEYGVVGERLYGLRTLFPDAFKGYGSLSFVNDLVRLQSSISELRTKHRLLPLAVSLLALPFPLQVQTDYTDLMLLVRECGGLPYNYVNSAYDSLNSSERLTLRKNLSHASYVASLYPVKKHAAASSKVNLKIVDLMSASIRMGRARQLLGCVTLTRGLLTEDQFINLLVYGEGLYHIFGSIGWDIAVFYLLNPKIAKNISVAIKALGAQTTREGAALVEGEVLQGRLAGPISLDSEARYRCSIEGIRDKVIDKPDLLRPHIAAIIDAELLDRETILPNIHEWWSSRWLWCVNGSQTTQSSLALGIDPKRNRATHDRDYRRMASEALEVEPITTWDGTTSVSSSVKLENGKQRAIFACDTRSYFGFSYILGATEKLWRNKRVILNPGIGGHVGITRRVRNCQRGGGVNLMLDYDDFNSHHSTSVMKLVFEVLCDKFNAPAWYKDALVGSFDKMWLRTSAGLERVLGTLMSGHRGTTFINSVLNAAYVRCAIGGPQFDAMLSLHAGDDVYVRCNTLSDCERILYACKDFGCRMNPTKQSIGFVGAEFLRVAIGKQDSFGYFARGVAGFVSGNWVTFDPLKPLEGLANAISGTRTLINRCGSTALPRLLGPALRWTRGINARMLIRLLAGELALQGGPVFNTDGWIRNVAATTTTDPAPAPHPSWSRNATRDYLTDHLSPIEVTALQMTGVDAATLLVTSSYSKGLNKVTSQPTPRFTFRKLKPRLAYGYASAIDLLDAKPETGVLARYPVLRLFETRLTDGQLRELVQLEGGDSSARDIRSEAFGRAAVSKNIIGTLSYGDAASLSTRTTSDNIYVIHPVYV